MKEEVDKLKLQTLTEKAIVESEKVKPSSQPSYWAKRSCSKCYGRGIVGVITQKIGTNTIKNEQICNCSSNRFKRWRDDFVDNFIRNYKEPVETTEPIDKTT